MPFNEMSGWILALYIVAHALLILLAIVWLIVPFILMEIRRNTERSARAAEIAASAAERCATRLESLVRQMQWTTERVFEIRTGKPIAKVPTAPDWPAITDDTQPETE